MKPTEGTGDRNGAVKWRDRPPPRLMFTKLCVLLSIIGCCMTVFDVETDRHIINHGVRVEGIVERADYYHSGRNTYTTALRVRYEHPDGTSVWFEQRIRGSNEQGPKAKAGETVTVFYDPHTDPEEAILEKWRAGYSLPLGLFFAGVLLVIGIFEQLFTAASVPSPYPPRRYGNEAEEKDGLRGSNPSPDGPAGAAPSAASPEPPAAGR